MDKESESRGDVIDRLHEKLADLEHENRRLRNQLKRTEDLFDEYGWGNVREHLFGEENPFAGLQFDKDAPAVEGGELPRSGGVERSVVRVGEDCLEWRKSRVGDADKGLKQNESSAFEWPKLSESSAGMKRVLGRLVSLEGQVEGLQNTVNRYDPNVRLDEVERKVEFHGKMVEEFAEDGKSQTEFDDEVLARLDAIEERFENVARDVSSVQARQSWVDKDLEALKKDKVNVLLSKVDALEADNARLWGWKKDVESFNDKLERHLYYHKVQIAFMCDHFKIRNYLADLNVGKWLGPELKQDDGKDVIEDVNAMKEDIKNSRVLINDQRNFKELDRRELRLVRDLVLDMYSQYGSRRLGGPDTVHPNYRELRRMQEREQEIEKKEEESG